MTIISKLSKPFQFACKESIQNVLFCKLKLENTRSSIDLIDQLDVDKSIGSKFKFSSESISKYSTIYCLLVSSSNNESISTKYTFNK